MAGVMAAVTDTTTIVRAWAGSVVKAMAIDVQDDFHVAGFAPPLAAADCTNVEPRCERNRDRLLALFDEHQTRSTFFVLGWVTERYPELIRELHRRGHEVACHGLTHELVYKQTPEVFRDETLRSKAMLEDLTGTAVLGYRAASYSITRASWWALDILTDLGFVYDSSIFPVYHDLYGVPDAPREPHKVGAARRLLEVPLTTVPFAGQRLPCAGGGYFRLLPYSLF